MTDNEKSTHSPHLVADKAGIAIAMWITVSIIAIWIVVMLMGEAVTVH